jgi:hypothetical protein
MSQPCNRVGKARCFFPSEKVDELRDHFLIRGLSDAIPNKGREGSKLAVGHQIEVFKKEGEIGQSGGGIDSG